MLPIGPGLLESGFHALFLDARKHGKSDDEDFMSMPRFAEDLEAAIGSMLERDDVTDGVIVDTSECRAVADEPFRVGRAVLSAQRHHLGRDVDA